MPRLSRVTRPVFGGSGRLNRVVRPFIRYSLRRREGYGQRARDELARIPPLCGGAKARAMNQVEMEHVAVGVGLSIERPASLLFGSAACRLFLESLTRPTKNHVFHGIHESNLLTT